MHEHIAPFVYGVTLENVIEKKYFRHKYTFIVWYERILNEYSV